MHKGAIVLNEIEEWIDSTNAKFKSKRQSCLLFTEHFRGFYTQDLLSKSYFVVTDRLPKPDFPELRDAGLSEFLDDESDGITYKDTYYILPHFASSLRLHFHELVHVAQWKSLGPRNFIQRYISELNEFGYDHAPLESVAYYFDRHFSEGKPQVDVLNFIESYFK